MRPGRSIGRSCRWGRHPAVRVRPTASAWLAVLAAANLAVVSAQQPPASATTPERHEVTGMVISVHPSRERFVVSHESIPGVMPAMTMAFDVADKQMLKGLKAGDKVRAQFDTVKGKMLVTTLERAK